MKPNEPKSSAAAACPASARNTRERESKMREGGREKERKNKMREIEWRVQKTGLKSMWAIATPQPPFTLFISSCILFLSTLFSFIKPLFLPFLQDKRNKRKKSPKVFLG